MTGISVFIPSYNQAAFLRESVESALAQSSANQVLVSDDKSTDASRSILGTLAGTESLLVVLSQERNLGIPGNIDSGLRAASGDFILRLDADDRLLPGACKTLADALVLHPRAGVAHGQIWEINESGARVRARRLARTPGFQDARTALLEAAKGYRVAANLLMFRREALASVNYLKGRPSFAEDYHLYVALAAAGWGNVYVGADIGEYRSYTNTVRAARKVSELQGLRAVFDDVLAPAYRAEGLPESGLKAGRKQLAVAQSRHLLEAANLSLEQQAELVKLLNALHPTPWPQRYLLARQLRVAPALLALDRGRAWARRGAKSVWLSLNALRRQRAHE